MFAGLLKEGNTDSYLNYFGKDKKKFKRERFVFGGLLFLICSLVVLIIDKPLFFLLTPLGFFIGYKIPYVNLTLRKKEADLTVSFLFPQFLQSFRAVLSSRNVYQMLNNSIPYTGDPLRSQLIILVKKIESGSNRREDYLEFAEFVGTSEAYLIMDMIYQFSEFGVKKETLIVLEDNFKNIMQNKTNELIDRKMASMGNLGYIPVFVSVFFVMGFAGVIFWHYFSDVTGILNDVF